MKSIYEEIYAEVERASDLHQPFNSAHEAYAVLLEEVDELWEEVKKRRSLRSDERMRAEAIQVAAMAVRFIEDVIKRDDRRGNPIFDGRLAESIERIGTK